MARKRKRYSAMFYRPTETGLFVISFVSDKPLKIRSVTDKSGAKYKRVRSQ